MKCKRTSDIRKLDHVSLQVPVLRQKAIKTIRERQDVTSVATAYGVNASSVFC